MCSEMGLCTAVLPLRRAAAKVGGEPFSDPVDAETDDWSAPLAAKEYAF